MQSTGVYCPSFRWVSVTTLALGLIFHTGCGEPCSEAQHSSVSVVVLNESGETIDDAEVIYTLDDALPEFCEAVAGSYICGWESTGLFQLSISAQGYATATTDVEIELAETGCHVDSQQVSITLDSLNCTDEQVPAVEGTVWSSTGAPANNAEVYWVFESGLKARDAQPCTLAPDSNAYACAPEETGTLIIEAFGGWEGVSTMTNVMHDGCHPLTQSVVLDMEDFESTGLETP